MVNTLNRIIIMGRICKDVELRTSQNGTTLTNLTVAVDRDYQSGGSERQTDFIDVIAFKNTASFIERNFHKGQLIVIDGRLQSRKWEDRDGNKRTAWEITAENVYFGGDKKQENTYQAVNVNASAFEDLDDDEETGQLPF